MFIVVIMSVGACGLVVIVVLSCFLSSHLLVFFCQNDNNSKLDSVDIVYCSKCSVVISVLCIFCLVSLLTYGIQVRLE